MKKLTKIQKGLYIAAVACVLLAAVFEFCMIGYRVSAVLFLAGAACLAAFGWLSAKKARWARRAIAALAAFLVLGAGCFLAAEIPVLADARSDADTSAPYLIVCGAGVNGSVPSRSMTDRLARAEQWLAENPEGLAVLTGCQGPGEDLTEARAMFDWLTARGADPDRLLLEEEARDSRENIQNSLALIAKRAGTPAGRVAILSSEYHLHRLGYMARRMGCESVLVAARTTNPVLFVNYAVREAFAMWELWVFGM